MYFLYKCNGKPIKVNYEMTYSMGIKQRPHKRDFRLVSILG